MWTLFPKIPFSVLSSSSTTTTTRVIIVLELCCFIFGNDIPNLAILRIGLAILSHDAETFPQVMDFQLN